VGRNNPCAVSRAELNTVLKRYSQHGTIWDTAQIGIVARCGEEKRVLKLPYPELVQWDRMKKERPEVVRLWNLIYDVQGRVFGESLFAKLATNTLSPEVDRQMQEAGQKFVPELLAGRFAEGFQSGWKPNASLYHAPVMATIRPMGQLANAETYSFDRYGAAVYPPLALQARVSGRVELELEVDRSTGELRSAMVKSGHPLLAPAAVTAAKQWRFRAGTTPDRFNVTIDFSPQCP
jgi:TonB family protein